MRADVRVFVSACTSMRLLACACACDLVLVLQVGVCTACTNVCDDLLPKSLVKENRNLFCAFQVLNFREIKLHKITLKNMQSRCRFASGLLPDNSVTFEITPKIGKFYLIRFVSEFNVTVIQYFMLTLSATI